MKILVLGSEGQIGKPTCDYLESKGHTVIPFDIKIYPKTHDLRISDSFSRLSNALGECNFVYYFASDVGGAKYLEKHQHTYKFIKNNMDMMSNVFSALHAYKKPFIFTSTQMAELSYSSYGVLKLLGEKMTKDLGGLVVRLWNVYGPEHDNDKSHVITDFCKMAKKNKMIDMRTDGTESRQLLYVEDCAECFLKLTEEYDFLDKDKNYHITSFKWNTVREVADMVAKLSDCHVQYGMAKDNTQMNAMNDPDPYILNYWKPKTSLEEGIKKIYDDIK
jgi:nucleoside-diphosphate-sugar epimerase